MPAGEPALLPMPRTHTDAGACHACPRITTDVVTPQPHSPHRLDPLLLTAALEALAAAPVCGCGSGADAHQCCKQLVGDSELATTTEVQSSELQAVHLQPLQGGSWPTATHTTSVSGGSFGTDGLPVPAAAMLCSSWDVADMVGVASGLAMLAPLGGSAPTHGGAVAAGGSAPPCVPGLQPLPSEAAAATREWNRSFQRRWREVKKRAYLQALGLRALWRVNSPSDRHEPLELLTNDLPQVRAGRGGWGSGGLRTRALGEWFMGSATAVGASGSRRPSRTVTRLSLGAAVAIGGISFTDF